MKKKGPGLSSDASPPSSSGSRSLTILPLTIYKVHVFSVLQHWKDFCDSLPDEPKAGMPILYYQNQCSIWSKNKMPLYDIAHKSPHFAMVISCHLDPKKDKKLYYKQQRTFVVMKPGRIRAQIQWIQSHAMTDLLTKMPDEIWNTHLLPLLYLHDLAALWCTHYSLILKCQRPILTHLLQNSKWFSKTDTKIFLDHVRKNQYEFYHVMEGQSGRLWSVPTRSLHIPPDYHILPSSDSEIKEPELSPSLRNFRCWSNLPLAFAKQVAACPLESLELDIHSGRSDWPRRRNPPYHMFHALHLSQPTLLLRLSLSIPPDGKPQEWVPFLSSFVQLQRFSLECHHEESFIVPALPIWLHLTHMAVFGTNWTLSAGRASDQPQLKHFRIGGTVNVFDFLSIRSHLIESFMTPVSTLQKLCENGAKTPLASVRHLRLTVPDATLFRSDLERLPALEQITVLCREQCRPFQRFQFARKDCKSNRDVTATPRSWLWHFQERSWAPRLCEIKEICTLEEILAGNVSVDDMTMTSLTWLGSDEPNPPKNWSQYLSELACVHVHTLHLHHACDSHSQLSFYDLARFMVHPTTSLPHVKNVVSSCTAEYSFGAGFRLNSYTVDSFTRIFPNALFHGVPVKDFRRS